MNLDSKSEQSCHVETLKSKIQSGVFLKLSHVFIIQNI